MSPLYPAGAHKPELGLQLPLHARHLNHECVVAEVVTDGRRRFYQRDATKPGSDLLMGMEQSSGRAADLLAYRPALIRHGATLHRIGRGALPHHGPHAQESALDEARPMGRVLAPPEQRITKFAEIGVQPRSMSTVTRKSNTMSVRGLNGTARHHHWAR